MAISRDGSRLVVRKRELFARLGYEPHPGQWLVHDSTASRRVLACGARWGKSTCGAMEAVAALLQPCESSLGWIVAPSYDLADRIFRQVEVVVRERLAHRLLEIDLREHRIVLRNLGGGRSEVRAKSADRMAGLLGEGLDWMIVDEAARIHRRVWETALTQRLIDRRGWALLISTPAGPGWFRQAFKRGQSRKDPAFESWSAPSWDNPLLDREVIEAQRGQLGADAFEQEYGGKFRGCDHEPCESCGGPSAQAPGLAVLHGEEVLAECPDCKRPVDEAGKTLVALWPGGVEELKVIRIVHRPAFGPGHELAGLLPPGRDGVEFPQLPADWHEEALVRVPVVRRPATR